MRHLPILLLAAHSLALAQSAPAFEVASVKALGDHQDSGTMRSTGMPPPITDPGRVDFPNVSLTGVLTRAYNVKPAQIVGPEWLRDDRFSIAAKVPSDAPKGQIPAMLQTLLAERFGLKVHWVTRQDQGYSLVVGKNGAKLTKSAVSEEEAPQKRNFGFTSAGHLSWKAHTLEDFANSLTVFMGNPVVDMTDLAGLFDIVLDVAPDSMPGFPSSGGDSSNPSITVAIRGLGLDLQTGKVSSRNLVVDSVKRVPTEN